MSAIALIVPTPPESQVIRSMILPSPGDEMKNISLGEIYGKTVLFTHCGAGKVNAAHSATLLIEKHDIESLILFGVGGAYVRSCLNVGDIAIAETENYGDEGVITVDGWKPMDFTGIPILKKERNYFNSYQVDPDLANYAMEASQKCGFNTRKGNFITVSMCSGTRSAGETMVRRFNGLCENMEGAAVAHICSIYDTPMVEIRGISNLIEDRDENKWNIEKASTNCNRVVSELIRRLDNK